MLVLGALDVEEGPMAHGALLAISAGLIVAAPTAITGLIDWLGIEKDTPARQLGFIHLLAMVTATVLFAATWLTQLDGYNDEVVKSTALVLGIVAELVLTAGGYLGGTLVFVYGIRVLKRRDARIADALTPGRAGHEATDSELALRERQPHT